MKSTPDKTHPPANFGDNITVPTRNLDKPKDSFRNIIADGVVANRRQHVSVVC